MCTALELEIFGWSECWGNVLYQFAPLILGAVGLAGHAIIFKVRHRQK